MYCTAPQVSAQGSRTLSNLPGSVLVNLEPLDLSAWSDVGPHRTTRAVLAAVYGIVQVRAADAVPCPAASVRPMPQM